MWGWVQELQNIFLIGNQKLLYFKKDDRKFSKVRLCKLSYCQTPGYVFRLGVFFVLPLSQEEEEKEED